MAKRVLLKDIAKACGFDSSTVSLALRNHPRITEKTRKIIQKTADEMGYRPDPNLSALAAYRVSNRKSDNPEVIAYVTMGNSKSRWKSVPTEFQFYEGMVERGKELGYNIEHFWAHEKEMSDGRLSDVLHNRGIRGIILGECYDEKRSLDFDWKKFIAVRLNYLPKYPSLHYVSNDQQQIMLKAFDTLQEKGYKKIGVCLLQGWDKMTMHAWTRASLWNHYYHRNDMRPTVLMLEDPKSYDDFKQWYEEETPDAVIGKYEMLSPFFEKMGISVPDDVAFADYNLCEGLASVSGMMQHHNMVGRRAVELLYGQLMINQYGTTDVPSVTLIPGEWYEGKTTPTV